MINMRHIFTIQLAVPWILRKDWVQLDEGGRPFVSKVDEDGIRLRQDPRIMKLFHDLDAACYAAGATLLRPIVLGRAFRLCKRCEAVFEVTGTRKTRTTARYCKKCRAYRATYAGRKEADPHYEENYKRYMKGYMRVYRARMEKHIENPTKYFPPKSQNRRGRKKRNASSGS